MGKVIHMKDYLGLERMPNVTSVTCECGNPFMLILKEEDNEENVWFACAECGADFGDGYELDDDVS